MNKRIIFVVLLTFLFLTLSACGAVSDGSKSEIAVLIKEIFSTYEDDDAPVNSRVITCCYNYSHDIKGNILTEETTTDVVDRIYDDDDNLISEEHCCYDSDGNLTQNRSVTDYKYAAIVIER